MASCKPQVTIEFSWVPCGSPRPGSSVCVCVCVCVCVLSCSVMSDSLQLHGLQPTRVLCPWDSPDKNTGVGCHARLQGNLPDPGIEPESLMPPALAGRFFTTEAHIYIYIYLLGLRNIFLKVLRASPLKYNQGRIGLPFPSQ